MQEFGQFKTYIAILMESLEKKDVILDELIAVTEQQRQELAKDSELDMDEIDILIDRKTEQISRLEMLEQGFELIYENVKGDMEEYKEKVKLEITKMQKLITDITGKSVKLQALEEENKRKMDLFLVQKRNQIKNFKVSSKTVANYYKNMTGNSHESTYFLDKKK